MSDRPALDLHLHVMTAGGAEWRKGALINTGTNKRYLRRSEAGQFKESDDVSRSSNGIVSRRPRQGEQRPGRSGRQVVFVFFSNRLGCVGSLLVTLVLSALLFMLMRGCSGPPNAF